MISLRRLSKRYGAATAVDDLTLDIAPGKVTGFLGPNGAGKSTTMRMIVGLDRPTSGQALVNGVPYTSFGQPLREVGALLDAKALHPGRSARNNLLAMAHSNGIPASRVDEVIGIAGLEKVAGRRSGTFSLGMGQRLGIAGALLGDPGVLMFDEPINGLDPDGVRWVRELMRSMAAEGRTVFVSSHLMSEMQQTADEVVVIGQGRLIANGPIDDIIRGSSATTVRVRAAEAERLAALRDRLLADGDEVRQTGPREIMITGSDAERAGDVAFELGVRLHELRVVEASLEKAYMEMTEGSLEYHSTADQEAQV